MSELHFIIQARSPVAVNTRKPGGSQYQELSHSIPGRVLRGVLATALLRTCQDKLGDNQHQKCPNPSLCQAILNGEALFRNALPVGGQAAAPHLLPATALSCKDQGGFIDDNRQHGIFDSLIDRACWEMLAPAALQYQPNCPVCRGRTQAVAGPYSVADSVAEDQESGKAIYHQQGIAKELLARVAINRRRGVAEDELLYAVSAMSPYANKPKRSTPKQCTAEREAERFPPLHFAGSIWLTDDSLDDAVQTLLSDVRHLGSGRSRGLGQVEITTISPPATKSVGKRLAEFNQRFGERWQHFASLRGGNTQPTATYLAVTLQSNAILTSSDGWQPALQLTPETLWRACGEGESPPPTLRLLRSYSAAEVNGGWNDLWGLRKRSVQVVQAGSVYLFQIAGPENTGPENIAVQKSLVQRDLSGAPVNNRGQSNKFAGAPDRSFLDDYTERERWIHRLEQLERAGIGDLRAEGFGQVRVCDEFHTIAGGKPV